VSGSGALAAPPGDTAPAARARWSGDLVHVHGRLRAAAANVLAVFFPPLCLLCEAPAPGLRPEVCRACRTSFRPPRPPLCPRCGAPGVRDRAPCRTCSGWRALDDARSALLFAGPVRTWIHELKYGGVTALARLGREPLLRAFEEGPASWRDASALIPVPLHPVRARERGFNQAELLAAELAAAAGLAVLPALRRVRPTRPQVGLAAAERAGNVRDAFAADASRAPLLRGRGALLVDDVFTTGATLESAAAALRAAGAARVGALTLARALPGGDA
jgi:ComF family protein